MHLTVGRSIFITGEIHIIDKDFSGRLVFEKLENDEIIKTGILNDNIKQGKFEHKFVNMWSEKYFDGFFSKTSSKTSYRIMIISNNDDMIVFEKTQHATDARIYIDIGVVEI